MELREYLKRPPDYITEIMADRRKVLKNFKLTMAIKNDGNDAGDVKRRAKLFLKECNLANLQELETFKIKLQDINRKKKLINMRSLHVTKLDRKRLLALFNRQIKQCAQDMTLYDLTISQVHWHHQVCSLSFKPFDGNLTKAFFSAIRKNSKEIVQRMVRSDRLLLFSVNHKNETGLHMALRRGFTDIAAFIVIEKGPINKVDDRNSRPLDIAIQNNDLNIVQVYFRSIVAHSCWMQSLEGRPSR